MSTVGFSNPLRFKRNLRPGAVHPLDGVPIEIVGQMQTVIDDPVAFSMDHFANYAGPLAEGTAGGYTLVGTVGTATLAHTAEDHGKITVLTGTTEDDNFVFRNDSLTINYATDRLVIWVCSLNLTDVDDMEFFAGITVSNSDFVAGLPASGLFFEKAETATDLDFHVRESGTSTEQTALGLTLVDGDELILAIRIENGAVTPYVHQSSTGWITGTTRLSTDANMPLTTDDLLMQIAVETGNAGAEGVEMDWMFAMKESA